MLVTEEQRVAMLSNGRDYARNPHFNPQPVVKLFDPLGGATWLLTDLDPDEPDMASGLCDLGMGYPELGSVGLSELEAIRTLPNRGGVGIERDRFFRPSMTISEYADEARRNQRISA
ncbi:MAG: DUF2958 domain-containing protein [Proteobacteria bacterium]|nr:DUF2958 domain-containing protein [Pseudomonadota bacterium]